MAAIKVHGTPHSTATMRVLATLYEKELEFEYVPVDMSTGAHKSEPFINLNPFGQVPAFEDGELKLFESRAINKYIVHEYAEKGTQLIFQDSKKNAILGVWLEVEVNQFEPIASKLAWELVYKPMFGMTTDESVVEESETKLGKVLDIYEVHLGESKYLAGDCFTLADLHSLPTIQFLLGTKVKALFDSRPNVRAWVADITSRAAWSKVLSMQKK